MWADLRTAFSLLTLLPVGQPSGRQPGWSFTWYPLVGLVIGGLLALLAHISPLKPSLTAFGLLAVWVILTGGLHLDGFGDSCDGLLATAQPARRLEIMKDPRSGAWAVIGLVLLLLGKWVALAETPAVLLIMAPVMGRWAMVVAAWRLPYGRPSGMGGHFRKGLGWRQVAGATLLAATGSLLATRDPGLLALTWSLALVVALVAGTWAARRLGGGLTGDVYGAICELTELLCLLGVAVYG